MACRHEPDHSDKGDRKVKHTRWAGTTLLVVLYLMLAGGLTDRAADENISIKNRGDNMRRFATNVGVAIVRAAHKTAKKVDLLDYKTFEPKPNRVNLMLKMEYHGVVSNKRYLAEILLIIDATDPNAWEVVNIEYKDDNNKIPANLKNIQTLIKRINQ